MDLARECSACHTHDSRLSEPFVLASAVPWPLSVRAQATETYTLHKLEATTGTKNHEYLGNDGRVFAVSWQGPFRPDLRQLLGIYYETYLNAAGFRVVRGPINIQLPGLAIHMSGHQRTLYGRAYIPDRVPQGLSTDDCARML